MVMQMISVMRESAMGMSHAIPGGHHVPVSASSPLAASQWAKALEYEVV